ncbi:hypothetical protein PGTUg99_034760 [Puccinia graminis f. sp. tritici]|uniref:Uncharacterized protein n=1 Tax=Puccinia graminis f. sp. tritici TaxID=56615 RepID=A0A5B0SGD5_PUCGR|nr:hypothetical protein PGTUg99_034760 [Puccinia graminis f. sp. tritici]
MFHQRLITLAAIVTSLTLEISTAPQRADYICKSPDCRNFLTITWCFAELPRCTQGHKTMPSPTGSSMPTHIRWRKNDT